MKFTGKLKEQVEAAESKEAVNSIIADLGIELTEEELDSVVGGEDIGMRPITMFFCETCGTHLVGSMDAGKHQRMGHAIKVK